MPLAGTTPEMTRTSRLLYSQGSIPLNQDQNWHLGVALHTVTSGVVSRLGSPNLIGTVVHTDTSANKCVYIEMGFLILSGTESSQIGAGGVMPLPMVRRIFHLQRWMQTGTQPPFQTQRMGKLITLKSDQSLWLTARIGTVQGSALSNADLGFAFRCSERETEIV